MKSGAELPPYTGKKRKIMIVIEDTGGVNGREFRMQLEGDTERLAAGGLKPEEFSAAEHWSSQLYMICVAAIRNAGAVKSETPKEPVMPGDPSVVN